MLLPLYNIMESFDAIDPLLLPSCKINNCNECIKAEMYGRIVRSEYCSLVWKHLMQSTLIIILQDSQL